MKKPILFVVICVLACALAAVLCAEFKPSNNKLSGEEREKLKRLAAQMQILQLEAQPLANERNAIYERNCKAAGVKLETCIIDSETGAITEAKLPKK